MVYLSFMVTSSRLFQVRGYPSWLVSAFSERYAGAISTFAITLLAFDLTNSATAAGTLGATRMLIAYGLAIFGGVVVDAYDRRRLMIIRASLSAAIWTTVAFLAVTDVLTFPWFFVLVCLSTVVAGFLGSASESALRSLVTKQDYVRARSINEARDASAQVLGSPISGALYGVQQAFPFIVSSVGQVIALLSAFHLPPLAPTSRTDTTDSTLFKRVPFLTNALAGFRFIRRTPAMVPLTLNSVFSNLGSFLLMTTVTLLLLSRSVSAETIGLIATTEAVGILLGSTLASKISTQFSTGSLAFVANIWSFIALLPVLIWQSPVLIGACYFLWAFIQPANNAALGGYRFSVVSVSMQGRVSAADTLLVGLPVALSSFVAGQLVDHGLALLSFVVSMGLLILAILVVLYPSVRKIPQPHLWPVSEE